MTLDDLLSQLEGVRRSGEGATARCPSHDDRQNSLSAGVGEDERILLCCHAGCTFEQIIAALGLNPRDLMPKTGRRRMSAQPSKTWTIRDTEGRVVAEHHRLDLGGGRKRFWWTRGGSKGLRGLHTADLPLYGSELPKATSPDAEVYLVEGEKAADTLRKHALLALGTVTGAKGTPGPESLSVLRGRDVILWPDFDDVGRDHMRRIAEALAGVAARVRLLSWGEQPGDDAADYFARGGTVEGLSSLVAEKKASAELKPAVLLTAIVAFIRRFVVLSKEQADVIALWVLHTWAIAAADATPFLAVTSAAMRSGKTRLLEVLDLLVRRPWRAITPSEAVLFRKVSSQETTLLLDETDAIFNPKAKENEGLRALLNAGNRRGATVDRCVPGGKGKIRLETFSVFCPRALAGIGKLPATVADRSIPIRLKRRRRSSPEEQVEPFRFREVAPEAKALGRQSEAWAVAAFEKLREARPRVPDALDDRQADGAEPLLAIADLAGGDWPARARKALVEICVSEEADDESLTVRLLGDVRRVFDERGIDRLSSEELVKALRADDEAPWDDLRGRPLTPRTLGRLLGPFGVKSRTIRLDYGTAKGYLRAFFEDAWGRYIPCPSSPEASLSSPPEVPVSCSGASYPSEASQINNDTGFLDFFDPSHTPLVTYEKNAKSPIKTGIVTDVTDKKLQDKKQEQVGPEEATPEETREAGDDEDQEALL